MVSVSQNTTLTQYQNFVREVYSIPNDRNYTLSDMLDNVERFTMRALKGIRKNDYDKTKLNLIIALSWFMSLNNQLHINIENEVWKRFPNKCSYCGSSPCTCKQNKI